MTVKIAVVTGANKGIGYAIVNGLYEKFDGIVYLTARDVARGRTAVGKIGSSDGKILFHQLDVTDQESVNTFRDHIAKKHGGIDLLVNNAAIYFGDKTNPSTEEFVEEVKKTIKVNYFGLLRVCEALFPLLRTQACVVNLSSSAGHLSRIPSTKLRERFSNPALTVQQLNDLMNEFINAVKNKSFEEWGVSSYVVSKVGVSALTIIHQREFDKEKPSAHIRVNSVHPGFVDTDMTRHKGTLTVEEGARAPLFLALKQHNLKGQYVWNDCRVIDWTASSVKPK